MAGLVFATAAGLGGWLILHGGWPIALIGALSLAAGWAYSGGPWPISYSSLGELFVWLFFGVVAVAGSGEGRRGEAGMSGADDDMTIQCPGRRGRRGMQ